MAQQELEKEVARLSDAELTDALALPRTASSCRFSERMVKLVQSTV
jgi:hypothetical protein